MSIQSINNPNTLENGQLGEVVSDVHSCSVCEIKFKRVSDLELHSQLHDENNDYKCSLCNDVFSDLEQLKLHDLRHSLEEAEEDATDIEQMILPFGLKSCNICDEKFSCDEELINHYMNHPDEGGMHSSCDEGILNCSEVVEGEVRADIIENPEDCVSPENEDGETNYQILRQEIVKDEFGKTDIHFILIDHQNEQVEEFTHTIPSQVKQIANKKKKTIAKSGDKRNGNIAKYSNNQRPKRTRAGDEVVFLGTKKRRRTGDDDVLFVKSADAASEKSAKIEDDNEVVCVGEIEFDNKSRRSKQVALRRKLWAEKVHLPPAQKLKDCPTCNKSFGDSDDFKKHVLTHKVSSYDILNKTQDNDWVEISCEICSKTFTMRKGLKKHLVQVHKLDLKKADEYLDRVEHSSATYYTCKKCKKQFYKESRLNTHDCVPAIAVVCELCNQNLSSKSILKKHLLSSHKLEVRKVNSIMAQLANYNARFYKKLEAIGEVAVSSSDGRLIRKEKGSKLTIDQGPRCDICNKTVAGELEGHKCVSKIQIKCEICKYNSPSKYNLKRHLMRIHKLSLNDAEKAMSEFKCYNERLTLRFLVDKKKSSVRTNVKSPSLSEVASKKIINTVSSKTSSFKSVQDIKSRAKEILLNKRKKLLGGKVVKNQNRVSTQRPSSKNSNMPKIAKEKMKHTSADSIRIRKLVAKKSGNYFGKNIRLLRSNKK